MTARPRPFVCSPTAHEVKRRIDKGLPGILQNIERWQSTMRQINAVQWTTCGRDGCLIKTGERCPRCVLDLRAGEARAGWEAA